MSYKLLITILVTLSVYVNGFYVNQDRELIEEQVCLLPHFLLAILLLEMMFKSIIFLQKPHGPYNYLTGRSKRNVNGLDDTHIFKASPQRPREENIINVNILPNNDDSYVAGMTGTPYARQPITNNRY